MEQGRHRRTLASDEWFVTTTSGKLTEKAKRDRDAGSENDGAQRFPLGIVTIGLHALAVSEAHRTARTESRMTWQPTPRKNPAKSFPIVLSAAFL